MLAHTSYSGYHTHRTSAQIALTAGYRLLLDIL